MTSPLVAGAVAGYGVALPVGAVTTYLVGLGARESLRTSAAAALSVATTDGLFALVATTSGHGVQAVLSHLARPLTDAAAAALIVLAIRTVVTVVRPRVADDPGRSRRLAGPLSAYVTMLALTAMNPTTLVYFLALVLSQDTTGRGPTAYVAVVFALGALLASASWQLVLVGGGTLLGRVITGPRGRFTMAVVSAAVMAGLAVKAITS